MTTHTKALIRDYVWLRLAAIPPCFRKGLKPKFVRMAIKLYGDKTA